MASVEFSERWSDFQEEAGPLLAEEVSAQAPVATGQLAANQNWRDEQGVLQIYATDNRGPIAAYVMRGTRPHPIDPVNAKMLHWVDGQTGSDVFAGHVDHPGTASNPYHTRSWEAQRDYLVRRFAKVVGVQYALTYLNPWRLKGEI